jgi:hypothetical protein
MIITEVRELYGRKFTYTYSDKNRMIEREGKLYSEAYDPIDMNRTYTETIIPISIEDPEKVIEETVH